MTFKSIFYRIQRIKIPERLDVVIDIEQKSKKKNKKKKQAPRPLARLSSRVARASAYCAIARTIQSYDGEYRTQRPEKQSTAKDKRRQQGNGYGPPRLLLPTRSVQVCALRSEWSRGVVASVSNLGERAETKKKQQMPAR